MTQQSVDLSVIYQPIRSPLAASERFFLRELAAKRSFRSSLMAELARHVARMPGKRIRPALALLGAHLAHADRRGHPDGSSQWTDRAVRLATAVEMIHTATLLHDDVIDGATLRRGLSTLNAKWGDTLSVLSGDYLYSKAFCLLSELRNPRLLQLMSDTARTVCEGEVAQIQHQYDLMLTRAQYLQIIERKTASLMGASAQAGALLGGASESAASRLGVFGTCFGLAFQILDDTQDLVGDEAVLGKSLGTDLALGQMTLPFLRLRDSAGPELRSRLAQWFNGLPGWQFSNGSTSAIQEQMRVLKEEAIRRRVPEYCRRAADRYLARARAALSPFPGSPYKASLLALTQYLVRAG